MYCSTLDTKVQKRAHTSTPCFTAAEVSVHNSKNVLQHKRNYAEWNAAALIEIARLLASTDFHNLSFAFQETNTQLQANKKYRTSTIQEKAAAVPAQDQWTCNAKDKHRIKVSALNTKILNTILKQMERIRIVGAFQDIDW